ncbi:MAG: lycopene cyclase domain-containing protein [Candidatus Omnitrophota bacterium]
MKEYTLLSILSAALVPAVDVFLRTNLLKRKLFWLFILVIALFKLAVNGYLTGENIVIYNPEFFLGLRIGSIPFEDFLFGFSMVSLTIIFWEYFKRQKT